MICAAFVSPLRIEAGELLETVGACALPPVTTRSRLPAAS
jgi:hypothetical protein